MSMWSDGSNGIDEQGGSWDWDEEDTWHHDAEAPEVDAEEAA